MSQIGWVKIHRQLVESSIWDSGEPFDYRSAWVDLILMANHEDKRTFVNGRPVTIKRGQRLTSLSKLASRWHWSKTKVLRFLRGLEEEHMIYKENALGGTLLTLINYSFFQDVRNATDTSSDTASDTNTDTASDTASDTQTRNIRINKNDRRSKELGGEAAPDF